MKPVLIVLALGSAALLARRAGGQTTHKNARHKTEVDVTIVKTAVRKDVQAFELVPKIDVEYDEKNLIDGWLFAKRDDVNMFGDARGTKYEYGTPLRNGDGGRTNDKYAYIVKKNPDKPWVVRFPKHWGKEPAAQTRDYVKLPEAYGFGSSTLRTWIEENLARDAATKAEEEAAASPVVTPVASPVVTPESKSRVEVVDEPVAEVAAAEEAVAATAGDAPVEEIGTPTKTVAAPAVEDAAP